MLQQTTVAAVIPYYERWLKRFPDVRTVAKTPLQTVLKMWQGLGYYQRAMNLHKAAKLICREFNGQVPRTIEEISRIPGLGPYTRGAVLSIAYDKRVPIIDANVRRVVMRILSLPGKATSQTDHEILAFLDDVMPLKGNRIFNQAMMELGALICRNRQPLCLACPVKDQCRAYRDGRQEAIPEKQGRTLKSVKAVIAVIEKDGKFFIQKRGPKGLFANLWEFPGGKIERGETALQALRREVREELSVEISRIAPLTRIEHFYTQFKAELAVFTCQATEPLKTDSTHRWARLNELSAYPMPSGSARIVDLLMRGEKDGI